MTLKSSITGIIADDLTGANDTALQFHLKGCNTQILLNYEAVPAGKANTQAWAVSTETRNKKPEEVGKIVKTATEQVIKNLNIDNLFKKIDSTLRGHIGIESLAVLEAMKGDAALIVPAFPSEGRTTVGGYHLLKGMPLERTEVARDPVFPIYQSHIPTLLHHQVEQTEIISHIPLMTIMKGAGPILSEIQKMVKDGKKLIIVDAVTTTDMEQIALAIEKSTYNLLPCGSAGLAQAMSKCWVSDAKYQHINKIIPGLPILIFSGSKTPLSKTQIKKLTETDEFDSYVLELTLESIMTTSSDEFIKKIKIHLETEEVVVVHFSEESPHDDTFIKYGVLKENLSGLFIDYLAKLSGKLIREHELIFVTIGGETSYRCCSAIGTKHLQLIDEVEPCIPICLDHEAQWIVTKSGNFGTPNTLVNIVKYFRQHQESDD